MIRNLEREKARKQRRKAKQVERPTKSDIALTIKTFNAWIRWRDQNKCKIHEGLRNLGPDRFNALHERLQFPVKCSSNMQSNHLISASNRRLMIDSMNAVCGCGGFNHWASMNQSGWREIWHILWPETASYLDKMRTVTCKWTKSDLADMRKRYALR